MREWGPDVGPRYVKRVYELSALPRFDDVFTIVQMRAHWLRSRPEDCALDIVGRWRLLVRRGARDEQVMIQEVNNHYGD